MSGLSGELILVATLSSPSTILESSRLVSREAPCGSEEGRREKKTGKLFDNCFVLKPARSKSAAESGLFGASALQVRNNVGEISLSSAVFVFVVNNQGSVQKVNAR